MEKAGGDRAEWGRRLIGRAGLAGFGSPYELAKLENLKRQHGDRPEFHSQRDLWRITGYEYDVRDNAKPLGADVYRLIGRGKVGDAKLVAMSRYFDRLHDLRKIGYYRGYSEVLTGRAVIEECAGMEALKDGDVAGAERRLAEVWRLSAEVTFLGRALIAHHRQSGNGEAARRIFDTYRRKLEGILKVVPEHEETLEKLGEWRGISGLERIEK